MAETRVPWMELNAQRSFPIEESATKLANNGQRLPDDVLVSAKIRVPASAGSRVCVGGIGVTANLVSITFVATDDDFSPASVTPVAVATVEQPVRIGYPNAVVAVYPGAGGWVAFGDGARVDEGVKSWHFSTPAAVPLVPTEGQAYEELPVPLVGRADGSPPLYGLVLLRGAGDIIVEAATRDLGNGDERVILFRLDTSESDEILYTYAGPCAARPESGTCDFVPIVQINAVAPDADGNIDIEFVDPFVESTHATFPELFINFPISQVEACQALKGLTNTDIGEDQCETPYGESTVSGSDNIVEPA